MRKRRIFEIAALIIVGFLIIFFAGRGTKETEEIQQDTYAEIHYEPTYEYGIVVDSMRIIRNTVKRNQFLSNILESYKVDYQVIDELARISRPVFDVRKIRAGNNYTVICKNDSTQEVQYFVYEISPTDYIVFDIRDSIHVHHGEKEIVRKVERTSGVIESSLWNTMVDNNSDPNLANELSEIYAWAIDFFGIQKGDQFKVIYEGLYVDDKYIGIGKVQAALFQHAGYDYYAFYFDGDGNGDYFDEEANSMRRTFLKAPLRFKRISSRFSYSRLHPILKRRMPHLGVDYAASYGTPVVSVGDGVVIFARRKGANGNMVKIKHNGTYTTAYLHLSKFGKGIKEGVHVKQGTVIGYVGSTGRSTGPHLDFRFYRNGKPVDPLKVKSPPAKPVNPEYVDEFNLLVENYKQKLDTIRITKHLAGT